LVNSSQEKYVTHTIEMPMRTPMVIRSGGNQTESIGKIDFFFFLRNGTFIMNVICTV